MYYSMLKHPRHSALNNTAPGPHTHQSESTYIASMHVPTWWLPHSFHGPIRRTSSFSGCELLLACLTDPHTDKGLKEHLKTVNTELIRFYFQIWHANVLSVVACLSAHLSAACPAISFFSFRAQHTSLSGSASHAKLSACCCCNACFPQRWICWCRVPAGPDLFR